MNPDIKRQWVDALRSGDYRQGRQLLRFGDEFCCLGVLSDLATKANVGIDVETLEDGTYRFDFFESLLPPSIRDWAGLDSRNPRVTVSDGHNRALSDLNDEGITFAEIADLIDEHL